MSLYESIRRSNSSRTLRIINPKHDAELYVCNRNLTDELFDEIRVVYENNQRYYANHAMVQDLNDLEYWFMHVIEPRPSDTDQIEAWLMREEHKIEGCSYYCADNLRHMINISNRDFKTIARHIRDSRRIVENITDLQ